MLFSMVDKIIVLPKYRGHTSTIYICQRYYITSVIDWQVLTAGNQQQLTIYNVRKLSNESNLTTLYRIYNMFIRLSSNENYIIINTVCID